MLKLSQFILLALMTAAVPAAAHPHKDTPKTEAKKKDWPNFGDTESVPETVDAETLSQTIEKRFSKHSKKLERSLERAELKMRDRDVDDLSEAARAVEDLLADSGILSGLADMVTELASDIEIDETQHGTVLRFDGKNIANFQHSKDSHERMSIGGLGKNMTIERENFIENGKTKTRIVIEMDGDGPVKIDLPKDRTHKH